MESAYEHVVAVVSAIMFESTVRIISLFSPFPSPSPSPLPVLVLTVHFLAVLSPLPISLHCT